MAESLWGGGAGVTPQLQSAADLDPSIRRRWKVINRGEAGSVTADWLPPSPGGAVDGGGGTGGGGLYRSTFGPGGAGRDAEVVAIVLGTSDVVSGVEGMPPAALRRGMTKSSLLYPESELSDLAKNVRAVAQFLRLEGRRVCVVDLPTSGVPASGRGKMRILNCQLRQVVDSINVDAGGSGGGAGTSSDAGGLYPVGYVPLGNNHRLMKPEFRAFDLVHLNRTGYKLLSLNMFQQSGMKEMMVNVEWHVWRGQLRCGPSSKKTS